MTIRIAERHQPPVSRGVVDTYTEGSHASMTREYEEKRRFTRYRVFTPAMMEMFDGLSPVSVVEMSVDGLRIQSASSVTPETHVAVRINVGRDIVFHCQIVWVTSILIGKEHMYQMGLQTDAVLDRGEEIIDLAEREILVQDLVIILERA
jgi:hypothetical protein